MGVMGLRNLCNFLLFQAGWLVAVGGAAAGYPWLGPGFTALWLLGHLWLYARQRWRELGLLLGAGMAGYAADSALALAGLLDFPEASRLGWPSTLWMACLWVNLGMAVNHSLAWLHGRPLLAALLGLLGGPLAYYAGSALGAASLPGGLASLLAIGALWCLAMPAFFRCLAPARVSISLAACLLGGLLALPGGEAAASDSQTRIGYAFDLKSGAPLYREVHRERWEGDALLQDEVQYLLPDGSLLATKTVDYRGQPLLPDFTLKNLRSGHEEGAVKRDGKYDLRFIKKAGGKLKTRTVPLPEAGVSDAGFDRLIAAEWRQLVEGKRLTRPFLIPARLGFIKFRIYQSQVIAEPGAPKRRRMTVEPASFWLRMFVDPLLLDYAHDQPHLLSFKGLSNMRTQKGPSYRARILFPTDGQPPPNWP